MNLFVRKQTSSHIERWGILSRHVLLSQLQRKHLDTSTGVTAVESPWTSEETTYLLVFVSVIPQVTSRGGWRGAKGGRHLRFRLSCQIKEIKREMYIYPRGDRREYRTVKKNRHKSFLNHHFLIQNNTTKETSRPDPWKHCQQYLPGLCTGCSPSWCGREIHTGSSSASLPVSSSGPLAAPPAPWGRPPGPVCPGRSPCLASASTCARSPVISHLDRCQKGQRCK